MERCSVCDLYSYTEEALQHELKSFCHEIITHITQFQRHLLQYCIVDTCTNKVCSLCLSDNHCNDCQQPLCPNHLDTCAVCETHMCGVIDGDCCVPCLNCGNIFHYNKDCTPECNNQYCATIYCRRCMYRCKQCKKYACIEHIGQHVFHSE